MEFLIGIGTSIIGKVAEYTVEPVGRQIGYIFDYKSNVENLKNHIPDLKSAKERIEHLVGTARRNCEEIEGDVQNWLIKADAISDEAEKLLSRDEGDENTRCLSGSLLKLIKRYKLSKKAKKIAGVIAQVQEAGKFSKVSYRPALNISFEIKGYEAFETRAPMFVEIMEALRDVGVGMIGVWGMGGVGKTMLVKEVARQARSEDFFTQVVLTTISQTADCKKVQEEVAENLGLKFEENAKSVRAKLLKDRLRSEKKILIIIDDIWSKLDLVELGISFADDQKECKIVLTSRSQDVLLNEMGVDRSFKLGVLSDSEAANLFNQIVGVLAEENEFQNVKELIVKECAGLPLAISVVANALKNKSLSIWKDALQELRESNPVNIKGVEKEVYSVIKLSYSSLESEEAKSLLLLCSLHKEDAVIAVEELMVYGVGLSLFHGIRKLEEARHRVLNLVENLKTCSLLSDAGYGDNSVRMHDVIRDVVVSIASKDKQMYFIRNVNDLNERLYNKELENSTAISCLDSDTNDLLPERLLCPELQLLSLQIGFRQRLLQIPEQFFEGANELKVLHLERVYLDFSRASSFQFLKNLKTLILSRSDGLGDVGLVGELKSLEILNFSQSDLKVVPKQLGKLTRLRSLNLDGCWQLEVIEPGVISSLELLEEFRGGRFTKWAAVEEVNGENSNACLTELKQLRHLTTLDLNIPYPDVLPNDLFTDKLERYKIRVGGSPLYYSLDSRILFLRGVRNSLLEHSGLKKLFKRVENLHIIKVESVDDFSYELGEGGFSQLKLLRFENDATVRYIINRHSCSNISAFQSLKELYLEDLMNLETICNGCNLSADSLAKLRVIVVRRCRSLKNLFPLSVACRQLEKIAVSECEVLEEIFTNVENRGEVKEMIEFPLLHTMELISLPKLMQFWVVSPVAQKRDEGQLNSDDDFADIQPFFHHKVAFPNLQIMNLASLDRLKMIWKGDRELIAVSFCKLKEIRIEECKSLTKVFPSNLLRNLPSLTEVKVERCDKVEEVFEIQRSTAVEESCERIIPQLTSLKLVSLPKLKHVWSYYQLGTSRFTSQNLKKVSVDDCHNLKSLFPASVVKGLLQLESLEISYCDEIQELVAKEEGAVATIPKFEFPQLTTLALYDLPELECFYPGIHSSEWPSLRELRLERCGKIKILASQLLTFKDNITEEDHAKIPLFLMDTVAFPNLPIMNLLSLDRFEMIWQGDHELIADSFCKLKEIRIEECKSLTKVFPSNLLRNLQSLTEVKVERCDKVEEVFEIQRSTAVEKSCKGIIPQLTSLKLVSLPKLKHVWRYHQLGTSRFTSQNLKKVSVKYCHNLKRLFPASVAKGLLQLESLEISYCDDIQELVAKEEGAVATIPKFEFPQLTTLALCELLELECFYPGIHSSKLPSLRELELERCGKIKILASQLLIFKDNTSEEAHAKTPLFLTETVAFPNLQIMNLLSLDRLEKIWQGDCELIADSFCKLKEIDIKRCNMLTKVFPSSLLRNLRSLTELKIVHCDKVEEVFEIQRSIAFEESCERIIPQLTSLDLHSLPKLKHAWSYNKDQYYPDQLGTSRFTSQNLQSLSVVHCRSLKSLFPASVAKGLLQLKTLCISCCDEIQELVAKEEGAVATIPKFEFPQLTTLALHELPKLECFYHGIHSSEWPSLRELWLERCGKIKILASQLLIFKDNITEEDHAKIPLFFMDTIAFPNLQIMNLVSLDRFEMIWQGDHELISNAFCKVSKIHMEQCNMLTKVFPSNLLRNLRSLKKLKIMSCDKVEEIFEIKRSTTSEEGCERIIPQLTSFKLVSLPKLKHVWSYDEEGAVEIVSKFKFPQLTTLTLQDMPELECFYPRLHSSEWPSLEELKLKRCRKIKILASQLLTFKDNITEEDHAKIPLFLMDTVTFPNLKTMHLDTLDRLETIWQSGDQEVIEIQKPNIIEEKKESIAAQLSLSTLYYLSNLKGLLVISSTSFQRLTTLVVSRCDFIVSLLAPSTARSMPQLKTLSITECKIMTEVIIEGDGDGEIVFSQLEDLILAYLPKLTCFHSGRYALIFPNMKRAVVIQCLEMQSFSYGAITPMLQGIITRTEHNRFILQFAMSLCHNSVSRDVFDEDTPVEVRWDGDINTTLQNLYDSSNKDITDDQGTEDESSYDDYSEGSEDADDSEGPDDADRTE